MCKVKYFVKPFIKKRLFAKDELMWGIFTSEFQMKGHGCDGDYYDNLMISYSTKEEALRRCEDMNSV